MSEQRWITVFEGPAAKAAFLRGLLESHGIDCLVPDELTKLADPFITGANPFQVRLQVREADAPRAGEVLTSTAAPTATDEAGGEEPGPTSVEADGRTRSRSLPRLQPQAPWTVRPCARSCSRSWSSRPRWRCSRSRSICVTAGAAEPARTCMWRRGWPSGSRSPSCAPPWCTSLPRSARGPGGRGPPPSPLDAGTRCRPSARAEGWRARGCGLGRGAESDAWVGKPAGFGRPAPKMVTNYRNGEWTHGWIRPQACDGPISGLQARRRDSSQAPFRQVLHRQVSSPRPPPARRPRASRWAARPSRPRVPVASRSPTSRSPTSRPPRGRPRPARRRCPASA
jgi:hypothetical protein